MSIHDRLVTFRLASRQLFNGFFRHSIKSAAALEDEERFGNVEDELFSMLVSDPEGIANTTYHEPQHEILIKFQAGIRSKRWLVNRASSWGEEICPDDAELHFEAFFDWDQMGVKDYQYVRVWVADCPSQIPLVGMEALVEFQDVEFVRKGTTLEA
jgi:hypothetical protein